MASIQNNIHYDPSENDDFNADGTPRDLGSEHWERFHADRKTEVLGIAKVMQAQGPYYSDVPYTVKVLEAGMALAEVRQREADKKDSYLIGCLRNENERLRKQVQKLQLNRDDKMTLSEFHAMLNSFDTAYLSVLATDINAKISGPQLGVYPAPKKFDDDIVNEMIATGGGYVDDFDYGIKTCRDYVAQNENQAKEHRKAEVNDKKVVAQSNAGKFTSGRSKFFEDLGGVIGGDLAGAFKKAIDGDDK